MELKYQAISSIKRARQGSVKVGKYRFTYRRPTIIQLIEYGPNGAKNYELARDFVIDWARDDGSPLQMLDIPLIPSPTDDAVPFDNELWYEWMQDEPGFWEPIATAIIADYDKYRNKKEEAEKNLASG